MQEKLMRIRTLTVALALSLLSIPSWSQWKETIQPPDSPYWWTLTDEVTPQELRRVYLDQPFHYSQYQKAQELGLWPSLSEEEQGDIALFVPGALTLEYHPFAEALWRFSGQLGYDLQMNRPKQAQALSEHGLSEVGITRLVALVAETLEATRALIEELDHDQSAFSAILVRCVTDLIP